MSDESKQVNHKLDQRLIYSVILVLMISASLYAEYLYKTPAKDTILDCFTGIGIGIMFTKFVFNE